MLNSFLYVTKVFYSINKKSTIMFLLCSIVEVPLLLAELFYTKYFIDTLKLEVSNLNIKYALTKMTILIAILLTSSIVSCFKALCHTHMEEASLFEQERMIIEKTIKLPMTDLDSPHIKSHREKAKRLDLMALFTAWVSFFGDALKIVMLMSVLMYYKLYILSVLFIGLAIIQLLANRYASFKIELVNQHQTSLRRMMNYIFSLLTARENIQEMRILKAHHYLKSKLSDIFNKNLLEIQKVLFHMEFMKIFTNLFSIVINMVVIIVLVFAATGDMKTIGQFIILYQIVNTLFSLVSSLTSNYSNLARSNIQFMDFKSYLELNENSISKVHTETINGGIEININNLYFSYPESNERAINGVNLNINPGEKVAFIGDNGSGKSTLVKLIMGLYAPDQGSIKWFLDDKAILCDSLADKIRVVFQDYVRLLRPIRENIALGDISKIHNDIKLASALKKADADIYSRKLDNFIGPEFGGMDISGGQWQRIAIARAYIKDGALLIYDEATSALDPESELKAFNSFLKLANNKTSIVVTHRLSMTRFMDKIAVLEKGKVVEYGSHEELIKLNGVYAKMYKGQCSIYAV